jgi:hypothetical protein
MLHIFLRILGGLVMAGFGVLLIMKTEWFVQNFGSIEWAEQHMGTSGGTRMFLKLIGIGIIFIGFLLMTGMFSGFIEGTLIKVLTPGAPAGQGQ